MIDLSDHANALNGPLNDYDSRDTARHRRTSSSQLNLRGDVSTGGSEIGFLPLQDRPDTLTVVSQSYLSPKTPRCQLTAAAVGGLER